MKTAFLLKYGEIAIKGKNRYLFENALVDQVKYRLKKIGSFNVEKEQGRIFVEALEPIEDEEVIAVLLKIFGLVGICPVGILESNELSDIQSGAIEYVRTQYKDPKFTFKVEARRSNKQYPLNSLEISCEVGAVLLDEFPEIRVDVHKPEVRLMVELRSRTYIYSKVIKAIGGMPVGTNGKATLMLSGGIDSPVAGYMVAKRGVKLDAVYFHAAPYTSERAKDKVVELAKIVASYAGRLNLHVVPFTDIQLYIYETCPHEELTIIMRRIMMRISEAIAVKDGSQALITGESIGQVASQTIHGLVATDAACNMPVFRPLIGFDKQDIIDFSEKIGTYETSILPFEDCCTIFVAKHPVTRPNLSTIEKSERRLVDIEEKILKALEDTEVIRIS